MAVRFGATAGDARRLVWRDASGVEHEAKRAYHGLLHDPVFVRLAGPRITHYGVNVGAGLLARATFNRTQLPLNATIGATFPERDVRTWAIRRAGDGHDSFDGAAPGPWGSAPAQTLAFTASFHPDAAGWTYNLSAVGTNGQTSHATALVRMLTNPTLTAFSASVGQFGSGPTAVARAYLNWTGTDGDPAATWTLTQTGGTRTIATLPSSRHLNAAAGGLSGLHRRFVQVPLTGGGTSNLRLTAAGEGGTVHRDLVVNWPA